MENLLDECTRRLLETTPLVIKSIRREMRSRRTLDLSVPQFRSLAFVHNHADASLSDLAEHLGLTLASTSKLADGLVKKGLMRRAESAVDRRRITLTLSKQGEVMYAAAGAGAQAQLAQTIDQLSQEQLQIVCEAFRLLQPLFAETK